MMPLTSLDTYLCCLSPYTLSLYRAPLKIRFSALSSLTAGSSTLNANYSRQRLLNAPPGASWRPGTLTSSSSKFPCRSISAFAGNVARRSYMHYG